MDIFKFSRGHFFGVFIPGAFLVLNLFFMQPDIIPGVVLIDPKDLNQIGNVSVAILFIISYVAGIGLRLLSPDRIDTISIIVRFPMLCLNHFFLLLKNELTAALYFNDKAIDKGSNPEVKFITKYKTITQKFPYSQFLFEKFFPGTGKPHQDFYEKVLNTEFNGEYRNFSKDNINHYKLFIFSKSPGLSEEIMYLEGLGRFISGITYSLMIILIYMLFKFPGFSSLFWCYFVVLLVFLHRHRNIRVKEILAVMDAYMYLSKEESNAKIEDADEIRGSLLHAGLYPEKR